MNEIRNSDSSKFEAPKRRNGTLEYDVVSFEAVIYSESGESMFEPDVIVTQENFENFVPRADKATQTALKLQNLGFRILNVGTFSVSGEASQKLWEETFQTQVEKVSIPLSKDHPEVGERFFLSHVAGKPFKIPDELANLVERAYPQKPPTFFESPLTPPLKYHHLDVPGDISLILRADKVHREGITGKGVLVVMPDSGFFNHAFYRWRDYKYNRTISPDAVDLNSDALGHGTAEAANIFSCAPDIEFLGIKMGMNATLAFKTAVELSPAIITCSWGWSIKNTLPNYLRPLESEIIRAVNKLGITVIFSAGNGHYGFPGQMPQVISAGGVYAHRNVINDDFKLEASDYASSFVSNIYPGRAVPDICGLVGKKPRGIYISLPLQPKCNIDQSLSGGAFPNRDETDPDDGWAVISGTSAAAPQIAGVCALLKQTQPSLAPKLIKKILYASARDVTAGKSAMGDKAGIGFDSATNPGLVDAYKAFRLARSIIVRSTSTLPPPR
ncbi:MAG: S8 family serine peptidase [Candidatus Thorarchaeota archaeon]